MELEILHLIQGLRQDWLDSVMILFTTLGDKGFLWIVLSIVLAILPRTRTCGLSIMAGLLLNFIIGNVLLKNIFMRARPFEIDTSVNLLIPPPGDYSFPSGHTSASFTAAVILLFFYRKPGIVALIVASMIAFSRVYLFVHYPTDVLGGLVLGVVDACLVLQCVQAWRSSEKTNA